MPTHSLCSDETAFILFYFFYFSLIHLVPFNSVFFVSFFQKIYFWNCACALIATIHFKLSFNRPMRNLGCNIFAIKPLNVHLHNKKTTFGHFKNGNDSQQMQLHSHQKRNYFRTKKNMSEILVENSKYVRKIA